MDDVTFTLVSGGDPANVPLLVARDGQRLVQFTIEYEGDPGSFTFGEAEDVGTRRIGADSVRLSTDDDGSVEPLLLTFDGVAAPLRVDETARGTLSAVFEIDDDDEVEELRAYPNAGTRRHVAWQFE